MICLVSNFHWKFMKSKISTVALLGILALQTALAQQVDYNKIILPSNVRSEDFGEKLVQLAWQNLPSNAVLENNKEIAELRSKLANWSWLNQIAVRGNLNEFSVDPESSPTGVNLFPRYNIGVTIPLGIFVSEPIEARVAKKLSLNSALQINQQKLNVRKLVLVAYQNFLMYEEILKVKNDLLEDEYANMLAVEQKFQRGEITIDQYKSVTRAYNLEVEEKIKANNQLQNSKLELESLIGVKLEDVN
jgi:outer membrane protein TolC